MVPREAPGLDRRLILHLHQWLSDQSNLGYLKLWLQEVEEILNEDFPGISNQLESETPSPEAIYDELSALSRLLVEKYLVIPYRTQLEGDQNGNGNGGNGHMNN